MIVLAVLAAGLVVGILGYLRVVHLVPQESLEAERIIDPAVEVVIAEAEVSESTVFQVIESSEGPIEWTSRNPAAYEAKQVDVDPRLLVASLESIQVGDTLHFDLFDGERMAATVTKTQMWGRDAATLGVTASVVGHDHSFVTLSSVGGIVRAWIHDTVERRDFQLRYDVDRGTHVFLHIDTPGSEIYGCGNKDHDHSGDGLALGDLPEMDLPEGGGSDPLEGDSPEGSTVLDVMVVYTDGALAVEGSLANMEANISQSFLKANLVHANSLTLIELNVVHTYEVDYNERSSATSDLYALANYDGQMDEIHYLRELYLADFVSFFVDTNSAGGLGFRPSTYDRIDYGYNLVRVQQSDTNSFTTVHELGHNMGSGHSKGQSSQPFRSGIQPYAAGWHWNDSSSSASIGYCSVMTYENFNSGPGNEYDRVPHFANPDVDYNGNATGDVDDGNSAKVFRDGRLFFAAFLAPVGRPVQSALPYSYGFESGEDGSLWLQFRSDSHEWDLDQSGATPSNDTGPAGAQSGSRYAYLEASNYNEEVGILSADFDLSMAIEPQIRFHYHMYSQRSSTMGDLYLEASTDEGITRQRIFSQTGRTDEDVWEEAVVDLSAYIGQTVRLYFRADIGGSWRSDIAIDSIVVEDLVADPVETFSSWLSDNYPGISDTTPLGDPDGDGVFSFMEYALGRSPNDFDSGGLPTTQVDIPNQKLIFSFVRARDNVRYVVQGVDQLGNWSGADVEWDSWSDPAPADLVPAGQIQTVEIDITSTARFVRLQVSE